jgi:AAA+ ATPase superfamily predicted ATPase
MPVPKPDRVFGRSREWRSLVDFVSDARQEVTLGVVSGRRRQGKTYLLRALADAMGGFYFEAVQATEAESLRMLGAELAEFTGAPAPYSFPTWDEAIAALFALGDASPTPVTIDEFPYLVEASRSLPSLLQRALDHRGPAMGSRSQARLLLCGSAMSVMGRLLAGTAPLRGRAGLELVLKPFDYLESARFWNLTDPSLALLVHSIVGGTPAYRRQFVRDDEPENMADFDDWVQRAVLNPDRPLMREARYLLAEEVDIRDPALYHSVLAAIASGNHRWGAIASYIGRKSADIAHPLNVLEDSSLIGKEEDAFRSGRAVYRITEPLITFYEAVMRPRWGDLEQGIGRQVWADSQQRFRSAVLGPHFEAVCRDLAAARGRELFGRPVGQVASGAVAGETERGQIQIDVAVLGPAEPGSPREVISLGEAKMGKTMGVRHLARLQRARSVLGDKGFDTSQTVLACYSTAGFDADLQGAASEANVLLADIDEIYSDHHRGH